jgi:hypothetical protein
MALILTYELKTKKLRVDGALGLSSVEAVAVKNGSGASLASGFLCAHRPDNGLEVASWPVVTGEASADTNTSGFTALFSAFPVQARMSVFLSLKDASGNLLASGHCNIANSCSASGTDTAPSGGPITAPAGATITDAGCPVMFQGDTAIPCTASNHADFIGLAINAGATGADIQVRSSGAVTLADWGLTKGVAYWLPQTGQRITSTPGDIALLVGIAQDANTLILAGGRLSVQPRPSGSSAEGWYTTWDATHKRLTERQAAVTGGSGSANAIPRLDADGALADSMLPASIQTGAAAAIATHNAAIAAHSDIRSSIADVLAVADAKQTPPTTNALDALQALSGLTGAFSLATVNAKVTEAINILKGLYS